MAGTLRKGRRVYIKELDQYGEIDKIIDGKIHSVQIRTPTGPQIIEVLKYTIIIVTYLEQLIELIRNIWAKNFAKQGK